MQLSKPICSRDDFLVFASPVIEDDEINEVVATMTSGWLGSGPKVEQFEREFKDYRNAGHAVALHSCTAALRLSMLVAGISAGDEAITKPMTFCATVNAIIHAGGRPVLADVGPQTMNIDPKEVRKRIAAKTRAIVPVHFAGRPCDMDALMEIAHEFKLVVIEDCAHAIETEYRDRTVGAIGDIGCCSFYVTKNVVTGEGGMVLTGNEAHASRLKILGLHGMSKDAWKRFGDDGYRHYQVVECGFKYNMMDMQAAIGIHQLRRIEKYWDRRASIWSRYMEKLADLPATLPLEPESDTKHGYHLFPLLVSSRNWGPERDEFIAGMTAHNIGVGVHYQSIPEHSYYQNAFGWRPADYPGAMETGRSTVSIPLSAKLRDDDVTDVIKAGRLLLA